MTWCLWSVYLLDVWHCVLCRREWFTFCDLFLVCTCRGWQRHLSLRLIINAISVIILGLFLLACKKKPSNNYFNFWWLKPQIFKRLAAKLHAKNCQKSSTCIQIDELASKDTKTFGRKITVCELLPSYSCSSFVRIFVAFRVLFC